ncbi:MAG: FecR family protein, partial [Burkholderiales bacterium]
MPLIRATLRVLAALCLAVAPSVLAQAAPTDAAEVIASDGQTTLVRGASVQSPVRRDVPVRAGDRIRTGADGTVQLRFTDGALMSIQPGSDFRIEAYVFEQAAQRGFFELLAGTVRAVSGRIGKRDRDDWRLRTPTATLGIRGTEFTVTETPCPKRGCADVDGAGFSVTVISGRVVVGNEAGSIEVPAGASLRLADARTVPTLALATPAPPARPPRPP